MPEHEPARIDDDRDPSRPRAVLTRPAPALSPQRREETMLRSTRGRASFSWAAARNAAR
ncbi:MAG TPA: hypothetical protein VFI42_07155 [Thermomicrobiaceae bacterium]|nr:hypothetical protein [Thermomicrobiaceae bacterium]